MPDTEYQASVTRHSAPGHLILDTGHWALEFPMLRYEQVVPPGAQDGAPLVVLLHAKNHIAWR